MQVAASDGALIAPSPQLHMARLADSYLIIQLLYVAAKLGIADLLARCYEAMDEGATLLLVEGIMPELARDKPGAIRMDLHMLLLFDGGRERTAAEFASLLERAGFHETRIATTPSPVGLGIIEAIR